MIRRTHRRFPHLRFHSHGTATPRRPGDSFERLAAWTVHATGGRWGFRLAMLAFVAWAATGPYFEYHQSWSTTFSLVTTSVTFLLVFLIQNAQNRESKAVHLKLDELIYAAKNARNELIHIEHLTEEQLDILGERYRKLAERHQGPMLRASNPDHVSTPTADVDVDVDAQVEDAFVDLEPTLAAKSAELPGLVAVSPVQDPALQWSSSVDEVAAEVAGMTEDWR